MAWAARAWGLEGFESMVSVLMCHVLTEPEQRLCMDYFPLYLSSSWSSCTLAWRSVFPDQPQYAPVLWEVLGRLRFALESLCIFCRMARQMTMRRGYTAGSHSDVSSILGLRYMSRQDLLFTSFSSRPPPQPPRSRAGDICLLREVSLREVVKIDPMPLLKCYEV